MTVLNKSNKVITIGGVDFLPGDNKPIKDTENPILSTYEAMGFIDVIRDKKAHPVTPPDEGGGNVGGAADGEAKKSTGGRSTGGRSASGRTANSGNKTPDKPE